MTPSLVIPEPRPKRTWRTILRTQPSAFLLAVQILGMVLFPWLEQLHYARVALSIFSAIVLTLAVLTVRSTRMVTWISYLLGVPALVLEISSAFMVTNTPLSVAAHVLLGLFYFSTAYALIEYMLTDWVVSVDELFAVGATFTVLAWGFAYMFLAVQAVWPGSFIGASGKEQTWLELLYLSVACLTSVGLSDVIPVLPHARSVAMLEQLVGVLYVAMVISRLVALTVRHHQTPTGQ